MKMSHASTVAFVRRGNHRGELEVLAFLYTKQKKGQAPFTTWRLPTETGEPGETEYMTASNGVVRELSATPEDQTGFIFKHLTAIDATSGEPKPLLNLTVPGDVEKGGGTHRKCVFLFLLDPSSVGKLRTIPHQDAEDELLGVPEFVEAGELWRRMMERGIPFHRAALFEVLKFFCGRYPEYGTRYDELLGNPRNQRATWSKGQPIKFERP